MKLILKTKRQKSSPALTATVQQQMEELNASLQIDEARVVVDRQPEVSPPFHVTAHLVTPGPDVFAAAADHTLAAALKKAVAQLARRIRHRHLKRARRLRNQSGQLLRTSMAGARF